MGLCPAVPPAKRAGRTVPILLAHLRREPEPDLKAHLVAHLRSGLAALRPERQEGSLAELLAELARSGTQITKVNKSQ